jgi:hypothetical protein
MDISLFVRLQKSAFAQAIAHTDHLVGAGLQIAHVVGLILVLAGVVLLSLRATGLGLRNQPGDAIARDTGRLIWTGFALAASSGVLMFVASAVRYATNEAFECKLVLLGAAIGLQFLANRRVALIAPGEAASWPARAVVTGASLLWLGAATSGRAIGYL